MQSLSLVILAFLLRLRTEERNYLELLFTLASPTFVYALLLPSQLQMAQLAFRAVRTLVTA